MNHSEMSLLKLASAGENFLYAKNKGANSGSAYSRNLISKQKRLKCTYQYFPPGGGGSGRDTLGIR